MHTELVVLGRREMRIEAEREVTVVSEQRRRMQLV